MLELTKLELAGGKEPRDLEVVGSQQEVEVDVLNLVGVDELDQLQHRRRARKTKQKKLVLEHFTTDTFPSVIFPAVYRHRKI